MLNVLRLQTQILQHLSVPLSSNRYSQQIQSARHSRLVSQHLYQSRKLQTLRFLLLEPNFHGVNIENKGLHDQSCDDLVGRRACSSRYFAVVQAQEESNEQFRYDLSF